MGLGNGKFDHSEPGMRETKWRAVPAKGNGFNLSCEGQVIGLCEIAN
jgi:hypothetical protein